MEKHFLDNFVRQMDKHARFGSHKGEIQPWYNREGDCIEFQTVHEGFVADRIDDYLTIYRSAKTNDPVGFQIKDVGALVDKYGYEGLALKAEVKDKKLLSVTTLLIAAYESLPPSISRRFGYTSAIQAIQGVSPRRVELNLAA